MAKKKKAVKKERVCMAKGYAYKLEDPSGKWQTSKHWEIVLVDEAPAKVLGRLKIDGADCIVFQRGKSIYAQTAISTKKC